ncbi:DUF6153 family protein [Nocardia transvalensis]|uniref:DUF6153 family protein n=1 Tax=Nocardia transvalensis TaxID=37333 RepID=UPI001893678B|nr:DUF6153 family protein [Nocardia transvalensis]MBF6330806.1 hypothetical protein [Nocardia transvalensis]
MSDQTQPQRRTGGVGWARRVPSCSSAVRALNLFVLVAGVLIMHAAVFGGTHHATAAEPGALPGAAAHHMSAPHDAMAGAPADHTAVRASSGTDCDGCGDGHAGMHPCVFVFSALALMLGLIALAWVGTNRDRPHGPAARSRLSHRARPPPWTVLSLAELAILRI